MAQNSGNFAGLMARAPVMPRAGEGVFAQAQSRKEQLTAQLATAVATEAVRGRADLAAAAMNAEASKLNSAAQLAAVRERLKVEERIFDKDQGDDDKTKKLNLALGLLSSAGSGLSRNRFAGSIWGGGSAGSTSSSQGSNSGSGLGGLLGTMNDYTRGFQLMNEFSDQANVWSVPSLSATEKALGSSGAR